MRTPRTGTPAQGRHSAQTLSLFVVCDAVAVVVNGRPWAAGTYLLKVSATGSHSEARAAVTESANRELDEEHENVENYALVMLCWEYCREQRFAEAFVAGELRPAPDRPVGRGEGRCPSDA